ncbi:MAG: flagellar biosynthesis protein FlhB [Pseudomonadota bacterium]
MSDDKGSKTEQPSGKRLSEARNKGQVSKSMEINTFAVLMAGLLALFFSGSSIYWQLTDLMRHTLSNLGQISLENENQLSFILGVVKQMAVMLFPVFVAIPLTGILINLFQVGPLFTTQPLNPDLAKLNPIKGLSRLFSTRALAELVKSTGKIVIIGGTAFFTVKKEIPNILHLGDMDPAQIGWFVVVVSFEIFLKTLWAFAILAICDFFYQKWKFNEDMKMTKQEVKEEHRQMEGDPLVKAKIRQVQREAARRRMMADVPKADVVVTNPTHLAVALLYDPQQGSAPMVVAKGQALIAEKIKTIAREHGVPILEDKPLARALYKNVELGEMIPVLFYQAVAEILSYVYRMKGRRVHGG